MPHLREDRNTYLRDRLTVARPVDGYRARLSPEILDGLRLAFEDDNKIVGSDCLPRR
jgi:hypothetical protein